MFSQRQLRCRRRTSLQFGQLVRDASVVSAMMITPNILMVGRCAVLPAIARKISTGYHRILSGQNARREILISESSSFFCPIPVSYTMDRFSRISLITG